MKFRIHSWRDYASGEMKMVIIRENPAETRPGFRTVYNLFTMEVLTWQAGELIPENFIIRLPWEVGDGLKKAFASWLHNEGVRPDEVIKKEGGLEGSLQATKYHLEDLRQLLKLRTPEYLVKVEKR
jgi:hypothetical protein